MKQDIQGIRLADLHTIARLRANGTTPQAVADAARRQGIDQAARAEAVAFLEEYTEILGADDSARYCNTDCARYRQGDCPFLRREDCPRYQEPAQEPGPRVGWCSDHTP